MSAKDLRALLDPLIAVMNARPKYVSVPESQWTPPPTPDMPAPAPIVTPAHTAVYTDPDDMPASTLTGDGKLDLGAQLALVQAAVARFADHEIRVVTGSTTFAGTIPVIWAPGQHYDVTVAWSTSPLATPKGAVARVDSSVAALGRVQAAVVDGSVTATGCKVRCTVVGAGQLPLGIGTPLTVSATGLYLYWPPFEGDP